MAKSIPVRKQVQVDPEDAAVLRWWEAQKRPSASFRELVIAAIERDGYTDVYYREVEQKPRLGRPPGSTSEAAAREGATPVQPQAAPAPAEPVEQPQPAAPEPASVPVVAAPVVKQPVAAPVQQAEPEPEVFPELDAPSVALESTDDASGFDALMNS